MVVSPRLPGRLQTLQKHPRLDVASNRPREEVCLPGDVLEAIMGCLDRESLRTARLVSKAFCAAASAHVCSLSVASTFKAVPFRRFPYPRHVSVTHFCPNLPEECSDEEETLAQLDPCLRDLATALTICSSEIDEEFTAAQVRDFLSQAALMPRLRKLTLMGDMEHEPALLARCTNVEDLVIYDCTISVARTVVRMTQLTSLHIGRVLKDGDRVVSAPHSWLGQATNLRNLQALCIGPCNTPLSRIGNLTGLTGLTVTEEVQSRHSFGPLTRLTRLRSLTLDMDLTESNLGFACSVGSGSLVNLELGVRDDAPPDCGRYLSRQTALTRLRIGRRQLCNLRHMGPLRIELLQCLELDGLAMLDAEGLAVLRRATSLTKLSIGTQFTQPRMGLSQVVALLTQLRSLRISSWKDDSISYLDWALAVSPLTALTELRLDVSGLDDGDLPALLVLTGLRVLELHHCRLTDDVLPELGRLTSLNTVNLYYCGVTNLAPVSKVLDPLRKARGLQPLHTSVL